MCRTLFEKFHFLNKTFSETIWFCGLKFSEIMQKSNSLIIILDLPFCMIQRIMQISDGVISVSASLLLDLHDST